MSDSPDWSKPSTYAATGVHHGYRTAPADKTTAARFGIDGPVHRCWWAQLDPGGFIVPHIDAPPWHVRWHVPQTPGVGRFWVDGVDVVFEQPGPIGHWLPHAAWNPTGVARVHLIVDLDEMAPVESDQVGLEICPMIPPIRELMLGLGT